MHTRPAHRKMLFKSVENGPFTGRLPVAPSLLLRVFAIVHCFCFFAHGQKFDYKVARRRMVENEIIAAGVKDRRVIESMLRTDRHEFVLPKYKRYAYFDMSLPIGGNQTISSPFIVAYMTESIDPQLTDKVLEIGTGSGFQAAILSPLVDKVYTIEIVESLGRRAARVLKKLEYENVHVKVGDGFKGWPEHAPFDKIIVTCSPEDVPQPLVDQLREGGRMVIPTGERYQQTLYLFTKKDGRLEKEALRPTLFVPMTGAAEEQRDVKPDAANPRLINGDFEDKQLAKAKINSANETEETANSDSQSNTIVSGWYYGRQLKLIDSRLPPGQGDRSSAGPSGKFVQFTNRDLGRGSHLLQGLGLDGSAVSRLQLSAKVRVEKITPTRDGAMPMIVIAFYDSQRKEVGKNWLGPWRGTSDWQLNEKIIRVPPRAREAIVRIGLFGATGRASFDDVKLRAL